MLESLGDFKVQDYQFSAHLARAKYFFFEQRFQQFQPKQKPYRYVEWFKKMK